MVLLKKYYNWNEVGDGKGRVSRFYFLKGLEKLLIAESVFSFKQDKGISDETWKEINEFAGIRNLM